MQSRGIPQSGKAEGRSFLVNCFLVISYKKAEGNFNWIYYYHLTLVFIFLSKLLFIFLSFLKPSLLLKFAHQ
jgi:hypothetical protein